MRKIQNQMFRYIDLDDEDNNEESKQDLEEKEELQVSIYTNKQYQKSAHGTVLILCSVFSPEHKVNI